MNKVEISMAKLCRWLGVFFKREMWIIVGLGLSLLYTCLFIIGLDCSFFDYVESSLSLNEIGDFFSGFFSPLFFLWIVISFIYQKKDLSLNRDALKSQLEELEDTRKESENRNALITEQIKLSKEEASLLVMQTNNMIDQTAALKFQQKCLELQRIENKIVAMADNTPIFFFGNDGKFIDYRCKKYVNIIVQQVSVEGSEKKSLRHIGNGNNDGRYCLEGALVFKSSEPAICVIEYPVLGEIHSHRIMLTKKTNKGSYILSEKEIQQLNDENNEKLKTQYEEIKQIQSRKI